jgi:4-diphosphocytidyl-2-C-methyl-D-erythritol kinase
MAMENERTFGVRHHRSGAPARSFEVLAPAKINLCLYVLGRRSDGYHELCTLISCVSLYDHLVLTPDVPQKLTCSNPDLPCDDTNLAFKALLDFNRALNSDKGVKPCSMSIHLTKHIPIAAGMGGGSSDAAAVLKGLNRWYGEPFEHERLHALALALGADVPFFIDQTPAVAEGIGERLTPYSGLQDWWVVLVYPGFGLSTAQVFGNLNLALTKTKKKRRYSAFKKENFSAARHLHNDLEAGVGERYPVIQTIKRELAELGALGSLMTGSGSVVYGLFSDAAGARKAQAEMGGTSGRQIFVAQMLV